MKASLAALLIPFVLLPASAGAQTAVGQAEPVLGPQVLASFERAFAAHGVAADARLLFVAEALSVMLQVGWFKLTRART